MEATRKTAVQKRDLSREPYIEIVKESKTKSYPPGRMLIASPIEIGNIVRRIPEGFVFSLQRIREMLATKFHADYTCPMTTGIFLRILAEAAEEEGDASDCPYWRVVRADGRLIDKLPGGEAQQAKRLGEEGVVCKSVGKSGWKLRDLPLLESLPVS